MEGQPRGLSTILNEKRILRVDIVSESFMVEALKSLFFHMRPCHPVIFENSRFFIAPSIGTPQITPKSLSAMLQPAMDLANDLYRIKRFTGGDSPSPQLSILQDSIEKRVISKFYLEIESIHASSLLDFVFKTKSARKLLISASSVISSQSPIESVFALARAPASDLLPVAIDVLHYFFKQFTQAITPNSNLPFEQANPIFRKEGDQITASLPSQIPKSFLDDICGAVNAIIIRSSQLRIESPSEVSSASLAKRPLTFEVLLPESLPAASTPEEEISIFRAAAWSIKPAAAKAQQEMECSNLTEAIQKILIDPLWEKAKAIQLDLLKYLMTDQRLSDVIDRLADLYLMKRSDLHMEMIRGAANPKELTDIFRRELDPIRMFEFRFTEDSIVVSLPHRLTKIIVEKQIESYKLYYRRMQRIRKLYFMLLSKKPAKTDSNIRMQFIQFLIALQEVMFERIEAGLANVHKKFAEAANLKQLIDSHQEFVDLIDSLMMKNLGGDVVESIIGLGFEFCSKNMQNLENTSIKLASYRNFIYGLLSDPAAKFPEGIAAEFLCALG